MYNIVQVFARPSRLSLIGQSFYLPLPVTTLIHLFFTNITVIVTIHPVQLQLPLSPLAISYSLRWCRPCALLFLFNIPFALVALYSLSPVRVIVTLFLSVVKPCILP